MIYLIEKKLVNLFYFYVFMILLNEITKGIKIFLAAILCFYSNSKAYGQSNSLGMAKGVVMDSTTQTLLSHVNVELWEPGHKHPLKSTLTNESGFFELTALPRKQLQLMISHTGYRSAVISIPAFSFPSFDAGQIPLAHLAKQLQEVQVATLKPIVEQDLDKITYNVEADPEGKTASALDILRKMPLLTLDADDNLQLNGNSSYRVLINGKSSSLFLRNPSEVLQTMAASAIKTIEIIKVPPSKFETQGVGGIINIITYKKNIGGHSGGLSVRGSSPKGFSTTGHIAHTKGKIHLSGNFGYNTSSSPANSSTFSRLDKLRLNRLVQDGTGESDNRSHNMGGEISWEPGNLHLITASYSTNGSGGTNRFTQLVALLDSLDRAVEAYRHVNIGNNEHRGHDLGLDYQMNFKKSEVRQLTLSYRWNKSTTSSPTDFMRQPLGNYKNRVNTTNNADHFSEHTLQADYIQPIKQHTLELGVHSISRENNSDYFYKNQDTATGVLVLDSTQSNSFHYKETIHAAYTTLYLRLGKWGLKGGARLEQAKIDARFVSSGTVAAKEYSNLIPNITLSRQLKGSGMLNLSYTQRIQRPDLYYLDPYVDLTDPWNISYGNPDLQPALAHVFQAAYQTFIKKTSIHVNFFHQFTNNTIQPFTTLGADTVARTTYGNLGKNRHYNLSLSGTTTLFRKLSINWNGSSNYAQYTSMINGKGQTNKGFSYHTSATLNLRLKNWKASTNMGYHASNVLAQGRSGSYVSNSVTVNKSFLKNNKASIGLSVTSPFQEHRRSYTEIDDPAFFLRRESSAVIRRFNLAFHYRFGKVQ